MAANINRAVLRPVPLYQPIKLNSINKELKKLKEIVNTQTQRV